MHVSAQDSYTATSPPHTFTFTLVSINDISSRPYINGKDLRHSRLPILWGYWNFVAFDGSATLGTHKQHAGPNEREDNFDLNHTHSDSLGSTWKHSAREILAEIRREREARI